MLVPWRVRLPSVISKPYDVKNFQDASRHLLVGVRFFRLETCFGLKKFP